MRELTPPPPQLDTLEQALLEHETLEADAIASITGNGGTENAPAT